MTYNLKKEVEKAYPALPENGYQIKYVPEILRVMLVPLGTFLVMLPLSLCLVAPAGVFLGNGITWLVETIYNNIGFLGVGVLSGLYPLLILTGSADHPRLLHRKLRSGCCRCCGHPQVQER